MNQSIRENNFRLFRLRNLLLMALSLGLFISCGIYYLSAESGEPADSSLGAAPGEGKQASSDIDSEPMVRLFWQDHEQGKLFWGDVMRGDSWSFQPSEISRFPELDSDRQSLVQMKVAEDLLLVGVRDDEDGEYESGWVALDPGIRGYSHGNHMDWNYEDSPTVLQRKLDADQGNPAHLYVYDDQFYLANDKKNGFTRIDPRSVHEDEPEIRFSEGGGNHITLAAVEGKVAYSSWIDGGGPNKGRVDVVDLNPDSGQKRGYRLFLSSGVIHGATTNSGKVFLAPADGITWLSADPDFRQTEDSINLHHLDLGIDEETGEPLRTGAFRNHRNYVLFTTGEGASSALGLIDAKTTPPVLTKLPLDVADGLSVVTPKTVKAATGKRYAFLFLDREAGEGKEYLKIVDLDPDGDRDFSDAEVARTLEVGASAVDGHHGHHDLACDDEGRFACLTNPGEGSIWVLSLESLEIEARLNVGGQPGSLIAIGARNVH